MSGSWERSKYDRAVYADDLATNDRRINYFMANPPICSECRVPEPGFIAKQGVSMFPDRDMIDVESDLKNLSRAYNRGVSGYKPYCPNITDNNEGYPCGGGVVKGPKDSQPKLKHLPECSFNQIDSRAVAPPCTLRGTGYDRWDPLCCDPQALSAIEFPGATNISYRSVLKDNFLACVLKPWDQTAVLPPNKGEIPCVGLEGSTCAAFTGSLQPDRFSQPYPKNYAQRVN